MPEINVGINAKSAVAGAKRVNSALGSIASKGKSLITTVFSPLNALIGGIGAGAAVVGLASVADEFTIMATQLEYLTGSAAAAAEAEEELYRISKLTGTQMAENTGTFTKLALASEMTGLSMAENLKVQEMLAVTMIKTGTSGQQASAAMLQLSQALASGKLQGDEFRSMAENAPAVLSQLATALGVTRGELKAMSTDGQLTSEVLGKAFLDMADNAGQSMGEDLPETVQQGWNAIVLAFKEAWDEINDQTGIMGYFREALLSLATWIEEKTPTFVMWFQEMVAEIQKNWPTMNGFIETLWEKLGKLFTSVEERMPTMTEFFSNLSTVVDTATTAIGWFIEKMQWIVTNWETLKAIDSYSPPAILMRAGAAYFGGERLPDVWDAATDFSPFPDSGGDSSGGTNINISQQQSRSDINNIISETQRQEARQ